MMIYPLSSQGFFCKPQTIPCYLRAIVECTENCVLAFKFQNRYFFSPGLGVRIPCYRLGSFREKTYTENGRSSWFWGTKKNKSSETSSVTKGHMALQNWPHFPQFRSHQFEENSGAQKMMCSSRRDGFLQSQTWWRSCGLITNPVNPPKKITTYGCWTKNRGVYPQNGWWK